MCRLESNNLEILRSRTYVCSQPKGVCSNSDVLRQGATLGLRLSGLVFNKPKASQPARTPIKLWICEMTASKDLSRRVPSLRKIS